MADKKQQQVSHYIHRTSYTFQEQLVGFFVLAAAIILLALLFSLLKKQNLFEDYFVIYGRVHSAAGLSKETSIQISGFEVGSVSNIEITDENDILLTLSIARKYHRLIRTDSLMKVSSLNATIIGRSIIEITAGSPSKDLIAEGAMLNIQESASIETVIAEAMVTLKTVKTMITHISDVVAAVEPEKIRGIVTSINSTADSLNNTVDNFNNMSKHMAAGQGGLGSLVYDKELENSFETGIANLQKATERLDAMMAKLNTDMDKVPEVVDEVQAVVEETRKTIEATQRIWPISSAMPKPEAAPLIVDPMPAND